MRTAIRPQPFNRGGEHRLQLVEGSSGQWDVPALQLAFTERFKLPPLQRGCATDDVRPLAEGRIGKGELVSGPGVD